MNFRGFRRFRIYGYVVLCTQCLRYNICSAWFLDIRISTCFELLSQANKQSPHLLIKTTVQHTTKVRYLYHIEAIFKGPCSFLSKTTKNGKKLNTLINQRNEYRFVSQARFATSHPIPFNS